MLLSKTLLKTVIGIALSTVAIFSYGHHGWSFYGDLPFILTAEVVDVAFGNPHDQINPEGWQWPGMERPAQSSSSQSQRRAFQ